ncbi:crystallin J1A-like isoform X2 [Acanthaster planci]|uniref:Crystallin J1A-like isoform X2 n=1 Tax=Acanthaster planci TaxID=133434 RepID=A0A8B7Z013_ACAPL|nr:crystallin J1A-like isoform X2 [Acanthaster planci]
MTQQRLERFGSSKGVPIHWIYNPADLAAVLAKHDKPEFIPEGQSPFYKIPTGSQSIYGDQCYVMLKSLVENKGLNVESYKAILKATFGPGTAYEIDHSGPRPIKGPWISHSLIAFLANYKENKEKTGDTESRDMDGVSKLGPLVALYAGDPKLMECVEAVTRVTQDNDIAVKFTLAGAKLLESYILNGPNLQAVEEIMNSADPEVKDAFQDVLNIKTQPHAEAVKKYKPSCSIPGCLQNSLHGLVNATDDFASSLRPTMVATGDNCGRLLFLGACLGAQRGVESLPADWVSKTSKAEEVKTLAEQLLALRK